MTRAPEPKYLLGPSDLPVGFSYPSEFLKLVEFNKPYGVGFIGMPTWAFLTEEGLQLFLGVSRTKFGRTLIPFAILQLEDAVAYFDPDDGAQAAVVVANPFEFDSELEDATFFPSFSDWLEFAKDLSKKMESDRPHLRRNAFWYPAGFILGADFHC